MIDFYSYIAFTKLTRQVEGSRHQPATGIASVLDLNIIYHCIHIYHIYWFHCMDLIYLTTKGLSRQARFSDSEGSFK
jgi:hypothetical protein